MAPAEPNSKQSLSCSSVSSVRHLKAGSESKKEWIGTIMPQHSSDMSHRHIVDYVPRWLDTVGGGLETVISTTKQLEPETEAGNLSRVFNKDNTATGAVQESYLPQVPIALLLEGRIGDHFFQLLLCSQGGSNGMVC
jgi:hypothetical protein